MYKEEVSIDSRIHSRIIGTRGRNILKIMDDYKVDIRFPRSSDPDPNLVVIQGAEDDVLDAKDVLLNMEEEYVSIKLCSVINNITFVNFLEIDNLLDKP